MSNSVALYVVVQYSETCIYLTTEDNFFFIYNYLVEIDDSSSAPAGILVVQ